MLRQSKRIQKVAAALFTYFLQEFAFHSQLPGGHFLCLLSLRLAGSVSVGNVDPQLALLLRHEKKRGDANLGQDIIKYQEVHCHCRTFPFFFACKNCWVHYSSVPRRVGPSGKLCRTHLTIETAFVAHCLAGFLQVRFACKQS